MPSQSERQPGISQQMADAKNRAWPPFKIWLGQRTRAEVDAADAEHLANLYPPLEPWEIRDMLQARRKSAK